MRVSGRRLLPARSPSRATVNVVSISSLTYRPANAFAVHRGRLDRLHPVEGVDAPEFVCHAQCPRPSNSCVAPPSRKRVAVSAAERPMFCSADRSALPSDDHDASLARSIHSHQSLGLASVNVCDGGGAVAGRDREIELRDGLRISGRVGRCPHCTARRPRRC